jgi:hypothetical protein
VTLMKCPVRIRMQGVVGAGGEKPPATRFGVAFPTQNLVVEKLLKYFYFVGLDRRELIEFSNA